MVSEESDSISMPASDEEKERQVAMLERGDFSEEQLEVALIVVPELFDPELFFVGRQLPTDSGVLDLLGIETGSRGFLKVCELKSGSVRRQDIAQVLDYMLWVRETETEELAWHLVTHGRLDNGIGRFWNPKGVSNLVERARRAGNVAFPLIVAADYSAPIARLANHTGVELYTVSELCAGWRVRQQ